MKRYRVERVYLPHQTLGSMYDADTGELICKTMELPWRNNQRSPDSEKASCIPETKDGFFYHVIKQPPKPSRQYPYFRFTNVAGRTGILIHRITNVEDLLGCIGVGGRHTNLDKDQDYEMADSSKKLQWMVDNMPDEFELEIIEKTV